MSGTAGGDLQSVIELFAGLLDFLFYGDQNYFIIRCNRALLDQVSLERWMFQFYGDQNIFSGVINAGGDL